uniref:Uncharacterized protein n=1 Tax=Candidatus Kentrum sp. SD TaxID=2126332 RepID=A0A451BQD8_9GAMM|nr:MAG: hypothetical protein BECKSD772D_GA0070982_11198 [Candidatus Kentron sp. SD]
MFGTMCLEILIKAERFPVRSKWRGLGKETGAGWQAKSASDFTANALLTQCVTMKQQPGFVGRVRRGAAVTRRF